MAFPGIAFQRLLTVHQVFSPIVIMFGGEKPCGLCMGEEAQVSVWSRKGSMATTVLGYFIQLLSQAAPMAWEGW